MIERPHTTSSVIIFFLRSFLTRCCCSQHWQHQHKVVLVIPAVVSSHHAPIQRFGREIGEAWTKKTRQPPRPCGRRGGLEHSTGATRTLDPKARSRQRGVGTQSRGVPTCLAGDKTTFLGQRGVPSQITVYFEEFVKALTPDTDNQATVRSTTPGSPRCIMGQLASWKSITLPDVELPTTQI